MIISPRVLAELLDNWVAHGVVTAQQAQLMRSDVPPTRRTSLVTEALGYLGAAIVLVAVLLLGMEYWTELSSTSRLVLVGASTVLVGVAALVTPRRGDGAGARMRAVLCLATSAGIFGFLSLLAYEEFGWEEIRMVSFAAAGTALASAALWWANRNGLQHVTEFAALLVLAGTATAQLPDARSLPGVAVWAVGAAWALLAWADIVRPPRLGRAVGTLACVLGAASVAPESWGAVLAVATIAALIVAAVLSRDLIVLGVAAVGTLAVIPPVVELFLPDTAAVPLILLLVGLGLVGAAVVTARTRRHRPPGDERRMDVPRRFAVPAAVLILAFTAGILLTVGWS